MSKLKFALLLITLSAFASCDTECGSDFDFTEETEVENRSWKDAESRYDAEPTEENCLALNDESEKYIEALNGARDCVLSLDLGEFLNQLALLEEQSSRECN